MLDQDRGRVYGPAIHIGGHGQRLAEVTGPRAQIVGLRAATSFFHKAHFLQALKSPGEDSAVRCASSNRAATGGEGRESTLSRSDL